MTASTSLGERWMKALRKGQYAFEFLVFFSFITLVFTMIIVSYGDTRVDVQEAREKKILDSYGLTLQQEFFLATKVQSGYHRNFTVFNDIEGVRFDVNNTPEDNLIINSTKITLTYPLPDIVGELKKGNNLICNKNGFVYLNDNCD